MSDDLREVRRRKVEAMRAEGMLPFAERYPRTHALLDAHRMAEAQGADAPGETVSVAGRVLEYADAGATDLMLGFADFPATGMLERFAREVAPRVAAAARVRAAP